MASSYLAHLPDKKTHIQLDKKINLYGSIYVGNASSAYATAAQALLMNDAQT